MDKIYKNIFYYGINLSFILYIFVFFGFGGYAPQYLEYLQFFLKIYISIILLVLFNPLTFKERTLDKFDRKIVFSSALFLLLSTTILDGIETYLKTKTQYIIGLGLNKFLTD